MSTAGYFVAFDPVAFEHTWSALRAAPLPEIQQAIRSRSSPERWYAETEEAFESNDRETLLDLLFTVTCVGPDADEIVIGRYVTLANFARQLEVLDPSGHLSALVKEWSELPVHLQGKESEPLIPAPRALLQRIWRRAREARPGLQALDASALLEARRPLRDVDAEYAALAVSWLGWLVEHTQLSAAFAFEGHTTIALAPLPPPSAEQMKAALRSKNLPGWDTYDEDGGSGRGAYAWVIDVGDGNLRTHARLTVDGERTHVVWRAASKWRRLLGGDAAPVVTRSGQGSCGEADCARCEAARVAAEAQAASR